MALNALSESELVQIKEAQQSLSQMTDKWTNKNALILPFDDTVEDVQNQELVGNYLLPEDLVLTRTASNEPLNGSNYRETLHELLYLEEAAQMKLISQSNCYSVLDIVNGYVISTQAGHTCFRNASDGQLFATMSLTSKLSEDSADGRLLLSSCSSVFLLPSTSNGLKPKVYEALIEDKTSSMMYLKLSKKCVDDLSLEPEKVLKATVQFQLNRTYLASLHSALDRVSVVDRLFPGSDAPKIEATPEMYERVQQMDSSLDLKQKEAVVAVIQPLEVRLSPVVVGGPYGTGKTFVLVEAIKLLLVQNKVNKILICTHSSTAADLFVTEYLHPLVAGGNSDAKPLRVNDTLRWLSTVADDVLKYSLIEGVSKQRKFKKPTLEDIASHRVVVTTLTTARLLSDVGVAAGSFTHIILDEAGQAPEVEALIPLSLANESTRIVLAGDELQMNSEMYSTLAIKRNLNYSLLERLHQQYSDSKGQGHPCLILLEDNYRSHQALVDFSAEMFYGNAKALRTGKSHERHPVLFPLTFCTTFGVDKQDENSSYYNYTEVGEVVERVQQVVEGWPVHVWGPLKQSAIGVVAPYYDQVSLIRSSLRRKKLSDISVERVLNVQGKQFKVLIVSVVRTRSSLDSNLASSEGEEASYAFLSDVKLLLTALSRAQCLVLVVGDPITLCSVGKCTRIWERYIELSKDNNSFYGMNYDNLRLQLESLSIETQNQAQIQSQNKTSFKLNPLAEPFTVRPRAVESQGFE